MSHRRNVQAVTSPDDKITGGRPKLWAYGMGYLAGLARVTRRSVRRAIEDGRLVPNDPVGSVCYALVTRGHRALAESVRAALGADNG